MKKKVYIRADGNTATGLGHLYRSFALMEMLKETFDCTFITSESSIKTIIPRVYKLLIIPHQISINKEPNWLQKNIALNTTIIADGYHFETTYQKQIKQKGFSLIYIDDLADQHFYADAVINHAPSIARPIKKEPYTTCYFGTKYAMLRPLFLEQAILEKKKVLTVDSVFVCFGGADNLDLTYKAVQALLEFHNIKKIHIVVGAGYKNTAVNEFLDTSDRVILHRNIDEVAMVHVMQSCQFAIAPASTIVYELCCVKMPILSGYYVPNQKHIYQGLLNHKVIFEGGNFEQYTSEDFKQKLTDCFSKKASPLIKNQSLLFDASIQHRFKNIVHGLTEKYQVRKAKKEDLTLFFDWANDPITRAMSFHTNVILLEDHKKWFANQLRATDSFILVLEMIKEDKKIAIGNIKCDANGVIGISLDIQYRGKGLGAFLINQGLQFIVQNSSYPCIFAYIKKENTKSQTVFEQAGFVFSKNTFVNKKPCLQYTFTPSTL